MYAIRSYYGLLLREETADIRLGKYGHEAGLIDEATFERFETKRKQIEAGVAVINAAEYTPNKEFIAFLEGIGEERITDKIGAQLV